MKIGVGQVIFMGSGARAGHELLLVNPQKSAIVSEESHFHHPVFRPLVILSDGSVGGFFALICSLMFSVVRGKQWV